MGQHPATMQPHRAYLLQPVSLPRSELGRALLQQVKHCRRVATRYDKLAANYLAFVQLASIRLWLRANESAS
jgi:transposase